MNPLKTVCPECGEEFTVSLRGIAVRNRKLKALVEYYRKVADDQPGPTFKFIYNEVADKIQTLQEGE